MPVSNVCPAVISAPVLAYPCFDADVPFVLEADASIKGLSSVFHKNSVMVKFTPSSSLNVHEKTMV